MAAEILAAELHLDRAELYGRMKLAHDNHRGFLWVKRKIAFEEGQRLRNLNLDWIDIQRESQRHYPNGTLAAHVLGGVDFEERGNAGIEKALEPELRGAAGHGAPADGREAARHRFAAGDRAAAGRRRSR